MELIADIIGNIGVACFLLAYYLLQKGTVLHTQVSYLLLNMIGSFLLIFSLLINWNLSAFLLEVAWALISMYGIVKFVYIPWRRTNTKHDKK
ncbi:MAG: hypothetical protein ABL857_03695 [Rickettsiales bacterium]